MRFYDRHTAGRALAEKIAALRLRRPVVLGLTRGGVPVAFEVSTLLGAPLDAFVVRKLGVPGQPELALGAVGSGGARALVPEVIEDSGVTEAELAAIEARERAEVTRRETLYRGGRPAPELSGRDVVLVDDGLATGASMRAAVAAVRALGPARVVAAAPVGSERACRALEGEADAVVLLSKPASFGSVGAHYDDFGATTDEEVRGLLEAAA